MNDELRATFNADQQDRIGINLGKPTPEWPVIAERDRQRHLRVEELVASGALQSAEDYR